MEKILLSIAISLLLGLIFSRFAKKIALPAVTAYLISGIVLGPFALGYLSNGLIGYGTKEYLDGFGILTNLALGFIAFTIGNEFRLSDVKKMGRGAIIVGICEACMATIVVDTALIILSLIASNIISLPTALALGAIASATAPAATLMVVKQYKAEGEMTKLLLMVVALDDAIGLILYSISFSLATTLESGSANALKMILEPLSQIISTVIIGCIGGLLITYLERFFHSRSKRLSLVVAFVILTVSLSMHSFNVGGIKVSASLLLTCMVAGCVFCNTCSASLEIMDRLDRWSAPLLICFFVISGAELDFSVISQPMALLVGFIYIIMRSLGKISGARLGSKITNQSPKIQKYLGITLLPQAGVALGMAREAAVTFRQGAMIANVVLFGVFIYEIFGPALTKMSLLKAGEIKIENRKSSRREN